MMEALNNRRCLNDNQKTKEASGNGLWESSRMMLPEHVVRVNEWATEIKKRKHIELDDQESTIISELVAESLEHRQPIKLKMYHEHENLEVVRIVDRVDQLRSRFMVDGEWFKIRDIEGASLEH